MAEKERKQSRLPAKLWLPPAITLALDIGTLIYTLLLVLGMAGKIPLGLLLGKLAVVVLPFVPYFLVLLVLIIVAFSIATYFLMKPVVFHTDNRKTIDAQKKAKGQRKIETIEEEAKRHCVEYLKQYCSPSNPIFTSNAITLSAVSDPRNPNTSLGKWIQDYNNNNPQKKLSIGCQNLIVSRLKAVAIVLKFAKQYYDERISKTDYFNKNILVEFKAWLKVNFRNDIKAPQFDACKPLVYQLVAETIVYYYYKEVKNITFIGNQDDALDQLNQWVNDNHLNPIEDKKLAKKIKEAFKLNWEKQLKKDDDEIKEEEEQSQQSNPRTKNTLKQKFGSIDEYKVVDEVDNTDAVDTAYEAFKEYINEKNEKSDDSDDSDDSDIEKNKEHFELFSFNWLFTLLDIWLRHQGINYNKHKEEIRKKIVVEKVFIAFNEFCKQNEYENNSHALKSKHIWSEWMKSVKSNSDFGPYMEDFSHEAVIAYSQQSGVASFDSQKVNNLNK